MTLIEALRERGLTDRQIIDVLVMNGESEEDAGAALAFEAGGPSNAERALPPRRPATGEGADALPGSS